MILEDSNDDNDEKIHDSCFTNEKEVDPNIFRLDIPLHLHRYSKLNKTE